MSSRLRLMRKDGLLFLDRFGWECRWGGIFIHHIAAPDPGQDLHSHPWPFGSFILKGGYSEERLSSHNVALTVAHCSPKGQRGFLQERKRWSWKLFRLTDCHTITEVHGDTWTLLFRGPKQQEWGFMTPNGFVSHHDYDTPDRPLYEEKT